MPTCRLPPDRVPAGAKDWRTGCPAGHSAVPARRFSRRSCVACPLFVAANSPFLSAACPPVFPLFLRCLPAACPQPVRSLSAACPLSACLFSRRSCAVCPFAAGVPRPPPVLSAAPLCLCPPPVFLSAAFAACAGDTKRGCCEKQHPRTCRPCKPGSVPGTMPGPLSFIWDGSHLPPLATYPPASGEQPLIAGIHGLATRETYCRVTSLPPRWALTPPFHPYLPGFKQIPCGRSFSVTLLYPHEYQVVSLRGALCCPDFPPPAEAGSDKAGLRRKGSKIPRIPAPAFRYSGKRKLAEAPEKTVPAAIVAAGTYYR